MSIHGRTKRTCGVQPSDVSRRRHRRRSSSGNRGQRRHAGEHAAPSPRHLVAPSWAAARCDHTPTAGDERVWSVSWSSVQSAPSAKQQTQAPNSKQAHGSVAALSTSQHPPPNPPHSSSSHTTALQQEDEGLGGQHQVSRTNLVAPSANSSNNGTYHSAPRIIHQAASNTQKHTAVGSERRRKQDDECTARERSQYPDNRKVRIGSGKPTHSHTSKLRSIQ